MSTDPLTIFRDPPDSESYLEHYKNHNRVGHQTSHFLHSHPKLCSNWSQNVQSLIWLTREQRTNVQGQIAQSNIG